MSIIETYPIDIAEEKIKEMKSKGYIYIAGSFDYKKQLVVVNFEK